jgi:hypothetical protein
MISEIVINSNLKERHSDNLGKECPKEQDAQSQMHGSESQFVRDAIYHMCDREKGIQRANDIYYNTLFNNVHYFSISIPPQCTVKIRGKSKEYQQLTVDSQYHFLRHRIIRCGSDYHLKNCLFIPEHTFDGNIHFHILVSGEEYMQTYKAVFLEMFCIDTKKFSIKNVHHRKVDEECLNASYLAKDPVSYCAKDDTFNIEEFNKSIMSKQYEKSKFQWIYFE